MKRLLAFMITCLLMTGGAFATDFKVIGIWDFSFIWADTTFSRHSSGNNFGATQRFKPQIEAIISENLKGVLQLESDANWGTADYQGWSKGGQLGTDGISVKVKNSYIDWVIPDTGIAVRMGLQTITLPGFVAGSNIFDNDIAGLMLSKQFSDNVAVTLGWGRAFNDNNPAGIQDNTPRDAADSFTIAVPLTFDGFALIPWATYALGGRDSDPFRIMQNGQIMTYGAPQLLPAVWSPEVDWAHGHNAKVLWAGLTGQMTAFAPFRAAFDFNYGNIDGVASQLDRTGWFLSALTEYKTEYGTPGIMGWYGSGDDSSITNGSERMPTFSASWKGTSMGWNGYYSDRGDASGVMGQDNVGTWGVSLYMKDISFVEKLSHTVILARTQGTNNSEMAKYISGAYAKGFSNIGTRSWSTHQTNGLYLTTADNVWELDVNSIYHIYKDLDFSLELGYMRLDLDKANWGLASYDKDAYRVNATFRYSF